MEQPISKYKFILIGDLSVGKTSFFFRLKNDRFSENLTDDFSGSDCIEYTQIVDGTKVKVYLYDTCGMERNANSITASYFRNSAAVLLFYSVEDPYSFSSLQQWTDHTETCVCKHASQLTWALIGNKCDLLQDIDDNIIEAFCKERLKSELSFKVSAKSGENVKSAFEAIVTAVHRKKQMQNTPVIEQEASLKLNLTTKQQHCSC